MIFFDTLYKISGFALFDWKRNENNKPVFKWYYNILTVLLWILLIPFIIIQLIGLFWFLNLLRFSKRYRKLSEHETTELKMVYGGAINYSAVRVVEQSFWAKFGSKFVNSPHLGFVFLNSIHFSRNIAADESQTDMAWLVHEVTHISQYQKYGIVYLIKSLRAQRNGGYAFEKEWLQGSLKDFNFEQQADIAKQYYLQLKNKPTMVDLPPLILSEIKSQSFC